MAARRPSRDGPAAPPPGGRRAGDGRPSHYASPPWRADGSRRRRCAASARSASGRPRRPRRASAWWATERAGHWCSRPSWWRCCSCRRRRLGGQQQRPSRAAAGAGAVGVRPHRRGQGGRLRAPGREGLRGGFDHTTDPKERVKYDSNPPTNGRHFVVPADDGEYSDAPTDEQLVHNLEHGRVIIWFKPSLPRNERADLKALFNEDTYQMVLVPREQHALPGGGQRLERRAGSERRWGGCSPATSERRHVGRPARVPRRAPLERPRADPLNLAAVLRAITDRAPLLAAPGRGGSRRLLAQRPGA